MSTTSSSLNLINPEEIVEAIEEGIQQQTIEDQLRRNKFLFDILKVLQFILLKFFFFFFLLKFYLSLQRLKLLFISMSSLIVSDDLSVLNILQVFQKKKI